MPSRGEWPAVVVELALNAAAARGLEREAVALAALHADDRLGSWRKLLPQVLGHGTVQRHPYRVDRALAGQEARAQLTDTAARSRLLDLAGEAIHVLHRATATTLESDLGERWVDVHLGELARHGPRRRASAALARLRERLFRALTGEPFSASWIHGDYWLGNVLCAGADSASLAGIVDWEAAAPHELPVHDLLHLVLYTRRLRSGLELGEIVRAQLQEAEWSREELGLLMRFEAWAGCGALSQRDCLLAHQLVDADRVGAGRRVRIEAAVPERRRADP